MRVLAAAALCAVSSGFVGPSSKVAPRLAGKRLNLEKLGLEKPEDAVKLVQEKLGDLDLDSAKSFASKNLDVLKGSQERALVDVAAAAFCGLLFAGVYGAVVFALGWFVAAPSTSAYTSDADDYAACVETAAPGAVVTALIGMLLTFKIFSIPTDVFAILLTVAVTAGARGGKLYLDTQKAPSVDDLQKIDVGALKWPSF
mmetsp:Transcript_145/g.379  ORF Transcript_145/g.379 Transcript_145/m.379 type:complete len:200 (-) Transcript_145:63-662(-)|eukprot:CAMPEP_0119272898 /NCGR_PEP_ID=MMETSP1329-20130426/9137_1 /TAXON_ID=114041 /ORGANISM="Genus nov. species nov., Strain RCC1024" /LENGTH=199 /DNA_ID=CAMNT_0007273011 /DNA_START=85 /DNA_END=684 /DNA_ORIENTATION=+